MAARATLAVACACAALGGAGAVQAQEIQTTNLDQTAQARALFDAGLVLAGQKQWELAADRFRRSNTLHESPVVVFNLTASLIELGRLVEATELLRQLETAPSATAEVRSAAHESLARTLPRIAKLTVILDGDAMSATVTLDGKVLDPVVLGVPIPADPGTHELQAMRGGATLANTTITVADGAAEIAHLRLPIHSAALAADPNLIKGTVDAAGRGQHGLSSPVYKKLWFWSVVTGVVAASVVTAVIVNSNTSRRPTLSASPMPAALELP